ncbi:hypothetical protein [Nocardiopsis ansamitocini]|uniref:hypothetical protein n=1 Tax=Nocardiopsis ansamitocini TaxID=1670832 RepID=UPI0025521146|nr:hypothetical protein [Nocardiopsis ansamitocini]
MEKTREAEVLLPLPADPPRISTARDSVDASVMDELLRRVKRTGRQLSQRRVNSVGVGG